MPFCANSLLFDVLYGFLANKSIIKIGHGLVNDIRELFSHSTALQAKELQVSSTLEITHIISTTQFHNLISSSEGTTQTCQPLLPVPGISLQKLTQVVLNKFLNKSKRLTLSNWHARPLHNNQIHYAACDSLVLLRLYDKLHISQDSSRIDKFVRNVSFRRAMKKSHRAIDYIPTIVSESTTSPSVVVSADAAPPPRPPPLPRPPGICGSLIAKNQ